MAEKKIIMTSKKLKLILHEKLTIRNLITVEFKSTFKLNFSGNLN